MTSVIGTALRIEGAYSASYPPDVLGTQSAPTTTLLDPATITEGSPEEIEVTGTGFDRNARVYVDGVRQGTHWTSTTQVEFTPVGGLTADTYDVTVRNGSAATAESAPPLVLTVQTGGPQLRMEGDDTPAVPESEPEPEPVEFTPPEEEEEPPPETPPEE